MKGTVMLCAIGTFLSLSLSLSNLARRSPALSDTEATLLLSQSAAARGTPVNGFRHHNEQQKAVYFVSSRFQRPPQKRHRITEENG